MRPLTRCIGVLAWILFTGGLGLSEESLLLQTIAQALQKRDAFFAHGSLIWDAQIEVIAYPLEDPEAFLKGLEQWDQQRPDAKITSEAKEEFLRKARQTHRCRYQTTITVMRSGAITSLKSEKGGACENGSIEKIPIYLLYNDEQGYGMIYGTGIHAGSPDGKPQLWIFSHSSPAPLNSTSETYFFYPSDWVFLANFSVLHVAGLSRRNAWRIVKATDSEVILEAELNGGAVYANPQRFRVGLSKQHGYAPSWLEEYSPARITAGNKVVYQSFPAIKIRVLEWRKTERFWMPQRWERVRLIGKQLRAGVRLSHKETRIISLRQIKWGRQEVAMHFPSGTDVLDFRLGGTDIAYGDVGVVPEERVVSYRWDGHLPSQDRLEQMARQQAQAQGRRPHPMVQGILRLVQWGVPLLLIAVGVYWWWRTRRS
ncbi:MAG: hypothetical protein KatS3mg016_1885 [Fimbriimonadales bacterium]|nr:MAG: hypothetical protein KatS3mg016_1885 [Fimbriimonadales bacterium]